jgi:hypothetical protein
MRRCRMGEWTVTLMAWWLDFASVWDLCENGCVGLHGNYTTLSSVKGWPFETFQIEIWRFEIEITDWNLRLGFPIEIWYWDSDWDLRFQSQISIRLYEIEIWDILDWNSKLRFEVEIWDWDSRLK